MKVFPTTNSDAILQAIGRSQAIIEFDLTGRILKANDNFCAALGYRSEEIVGQHHRLFVDPAEAGSPEYQAFWEKLAKGEYDRRQYRRIAKGGREIWIEASYNPVFRNGKPWKVVKIATDITAEKLKSAEDAGKLNALSRTQAVIEFNPDGQILTANENFLQVMGYSLEEIRGKHHSMFCDPDYARSQDYAQLWADLRANTPKAEEFMRIAKGGRKVFIQASYNPIVDEQGRVFKVVKFATDVTGRVQNVNDLGAGLKDMANGDLTVHIDEPFIPSLEQLRVDFNEAVHRLNDAMETVHRNAQTIASASSQVRTASEDLSRRTERQAASVEETAAALEEITQTVADSSRRAAEAGRLVADARLNADRSSTVVQNAIEAMSAIEGSSKEISNIISVIDEIAFQTNLLALNAGVEAARAGDAGRGFAVVAQEVRELAQRSGKAAKEIKTLITTSGNQVGQGVSLVNETGAALKSIRGQVDEININVAAIVEGAREQAVGLKEINVAVNTIDQGTQQNAAMVEESSTASASLASEASALFGLVSQFRLRGFTAATKPTPMTASALTRVPAVAKRAASVVGNTAIKEDWESF
ncbi:PAS domain S-box protein [Ciceribacter sp. L1K23]|uniref:methyl-accepting chemotaxis protein n=1 Tax=Ciceribacter sp. L1K23 TaxID=2820276 RepID=UPI001B83D313|nr:methyl-accepting chemotaxis protein [Ciceribacter sp. L1K23]MBR0556518.1 PAS domain S-box protein [Ciceribacter sp. L1K23]